MPTKRCCCANCRLGEDNFNRANENPVSGAWHEISGDWEVLSNQLNCVTTGVLATTICHQAKYTNGSYVMRCTLAGITSGGITEWEMSCGNPNSPNYVVEVLLNSMTSQATLKLYSGNKTTLIREQTYDGVTADREITICYSPGLTIDVSIGVPDLEFCSDVTGSACYSSSGTDVGGFAFRKGRFDNWFYDLHWLDLAKCEKCTCFCEKSRDDYLCYPDVLYLSFENIAGGATFPSIPLYQSFADASNYLWPEKVAWFSEVQSCGPPVNAQWTARFLCGQEDLGALAFGTAAYQFENPTFSQIILEWDDSASAFDKRDAVLAASTCSPLELVFPTIRIKSAFPSPTCTDPPCDSAGCYTPYCTDLNDECYTSEPTIQFTPKVTL